MLGLRVVLLFCVFWMVSAQIIQVDEWLKALVVFCRTDNQCNYKVLIRKAEQDVIQYNVTGNCDGAATADGAYQIKKPKQRTPALLMQADCPYPSGFRSLKFHAFDVSHGGGRPGCSLYIGYPCLISQNI